MSRTVHAPTTATDIMQRHVVTLGPQDTVHDAMLVLTEHHVSGLPIVDPHNHCIGVLSTSDVLALVEDEAESATAPESDRLRSWFNPETMKWEYYSLSSAHLDEYGSLLIKDVMTRDPVTVRPQTPTAEVAQTMEEHGIHRVFVVDEEKKLHGVISAFDFVRLAAQSAK